MATEHEVSIARSVIRRFASKAVKRHSRIHDDAMEDNANRRRALDGVCGHCKHLKIETIRTFTGTQSVKLRCNASLSPLLLYENTDLGKTPICPKFKQK